MSDVPDEHSVTCVICGDVADERRNPPDSESHSQSSIASERERETTLITDDRDQLGWDMPVAYPLRYGATVLAFQEYGYGEAHQDCFHEHLMAYAREHIEEFEEIHDNTPDVIVDGRFTSEGISVSAYDNSVVLDEAWFTYDEIEERKGDEESDFTFEITL